ncbi:alpha-ketoglutarate-dependent dioxygenase AlkB [Luteimonas wenzhouensis]|uniref:Alpha-ketoglutarate-dependent dioxygenase AlkB n=1 Tax=Luteimonas wenzhouensis TaxID=2599615 RepID=A0A5C5U5Y4_9GAMM|nr:alpha-ketoglutarate-dependent dioxygenase AlkB [Luteimonas wenzhouensis]TWT20760.1 alpha-ketoglutarate-dependent dioxygenase AlkB [Luteimonas wenzhouensis]
MGALRTASLAGDLFAPPVLQLVEDAQGGARYWPSVVDPDTARRWFDALVEGADWRSLRRPMYDRVVDVPRLLASYAIDELPPHLPLAAIHEVVRRHVPAPFTSIGMNLYRDGNDSVAMHGDKLHLLGEGHPVVVFSLGAPRRMLIRAKRDHADRVAVDLVPGSLLAMSHVMQTTHEHGIPKVREAGPRISVVFRARGR